MSIRADGPGNEAIAWTSRQILRGILVAGLIVLIAALTLPRLLIEDRRYVPSTLQAYTSATKLMDALSAGGGVLNLRQERHGEATILTGRLKTPEKADARFEIYVNDFRRLADWQDLPSVERWSREDPRALNYRGSAGNVTAAVLVAGGDPLSVDYPHNEVAAFDKALLSAFPPSHSAIHSQITFDD